MYTVKPAYQRIERDANIFPFHTGLRLTQDPFDHHKTRGGCILPVKMQITHAGQILVQSLSTDTQRNWDLTIRQTDGRTDRTSHICVLLVQIYAGNNKSMFQFVFTLHITTTGMAFHLVFTSDINVPHVGDSNLDLPTYLPTYLRTT
jgi:hypothetical protein